MSVSESDFELLEAYVDGELTGSEIDAVQSRLSAEPTLATALHGLHAARAVRAQVFESCEPEERSVEHLMAGVRRELNRQATKDLVWGERLRIMRYISATAACVIFAFFAGWVGREHAADKALTVPAFRNSGSVASNSGSIDFSANPTLVGDNLTPPVAPHRPGGFAVALTDAMGHVVAVQHFDTMQQARDFSADVTRMQNQPMRTTDAVLVKDQF